MTRIAEAVAAGDLDALIRLVDGLCSARDWGGVVELRDRARHAMEERGLQLWPAADYAEYRLALDAPGEFAGPVVLEGAGRFALGPLWEVAASSHSWTDLAAHIPSGPARALTAHERVLRGEDLGDFGDIDEMVLDLPLVLEKWEPDYCLATYRSGEADFSSPDPSPLQPVEASFGGNELDDPEATEALLAIAQPWSDHSNGAVRAGAVEGSAVEAIASLGFHHIELGSVDASVAVSWMAWAGASGGAYGRRRGGPLGRFAAWWAVAMVADVAWPPAPGEIGAAADRLAWYRWHAVGELHGWSACLSVEDADEGLAWALYAVDDHREEDELQE